MRTLLLLMFVATFAKAADVLQVSPSGNSVAVTHSDTTRPLALGEYACLLQGASELACGLVSKATSKGVILKLDVKKAPLKKGDKVLVSKRMRPASRAIAAHSESRMSANAPSASSINLSVGGDFSPSYLLPIVHLQFMITPQVSLGFQPGYVGQSVDDTKLRAFSFIATVNYYTNGSFNGLWAQVLAGTYFFAVTAPNVDEKANSIALGGTFGYRASLGPSFNVGAAAGLNYIGAPNTTSVTFDYSTIQPIAVVDFGINF